MALDKITEKLRGRTSEIAGLNKSLKLDFGPDGIVRIDDTQSPTAIDNQNLPTDCTVIVSMSDFLDMASGKINPQMAYMMGKLKVEGDMSVALQMGRIFG